MKYYIFGALLALVGCGLGQEAKLPDYDAAGSVCGDVMLRGTEIDPVEGPGSCGIPNAVRITEVAGVKLSAPARIDCQTARSFSTWMQNAALPAIGDMGGGASEVYVMASYSCRTRNSRPGAKLSEHSFGHALDIGGFVLADGSRLSVLRDWGRGEKGTALRSMRSGACGPFGTVLGPGSDRYHSNHFHFDTARYRSGPYCR